MTPHRRTLPQILLTIVVSLALLTLIGVTRAHHIEFDQRVAPIAYSGDAGEVVDASRFTIEVTDVAFGHDISGEGFEGLTGNDVDPDYIWMVVTVTMEATSEAMTLHDPVRVECGDTTYAGTPVSPLPYRAMGGANLEAGIPVTGSIAFELPADQITEPTLRVTAVNATMAYDDRLASEAMIDLGLGDDELRNAVDDASEIVEVEGNVDVGDERRSPADPGAKDGAADE